MCKLFSSCARDKTALRKILILRDNLIENVKSTELLYKTPFLNVCTFLIQSYEISMFALLYQLKT